MKSKQVKCPTCGKAVEWSLENQWRPFCSERCRLIDLGEWAAERHRIPSEAPKDFDEGEGGEKSEE